MRCRAACAESEIAEPRPNPSFTATVVMPGARLLRLPAGVSFAAEKEQGQAQPAHEEGKLSDLANQLAVKPVGIDGVAALGVVLVARDDPGHGMLTDNDKGVVASDHLLQAAPGRGRPSMQQESLGMQRFKVDAAGAVPVPDENLLHIGVQQTVYGGVDLTGHQPFSGIVVAAIGIGLVHKGDDPGHALHVRYH